MSVASPASASPEGAPASPRPGATIDPTLSLALAMRATPGAYALLLGSGVSFASGIPTGWGIVVDLIRKIAPEGTDASNAGLEAWYREEFGKDPDYADLLRLVGQTPSERRDLIRRYFEPTGEERAQGLKLPTRAHRAVARLVARGYVRVVVTTNFDQLLETALRDLGIAPAVIGTPDAVAGAMPLQHERATIIKVHGDYTDVRIKNTPEELASYAPPINRLLARVFDEYGLVVCGWSSAWDAALRRAISRAPGRRFSTFWAQRGALTPEARQLVDLRHASVIPIESADAFFDGLAEKVESLEALERPHPITKDVAVATLKRYLPRDEDRIRLRDLVMAEVHDVRHRIADIMPLGQPSPESVAGTVERLTAASETVMALGATGGFWWEGRHAALWRGALERLAATVPEVSARTAYTTWQTLARYPAHLAFYAAGVAASAAGHDDALATLLLGVTVDLPTERRTVAAYGLNYEKVLDDDATKQLPAYNQRKMAASDHLFDVVRPAVAPYVPDDAAYTAAFERFELLAALGYAHELRAIRPEDPWFPAGRAWYRRHHALPYERPALSALLQETAAAGGDWFLLRRGLFDGSEPMLRQMLSALNQQTQRWVG